jgi:phage repressor protein C with HTH and peptisase S24 domain
MNPDAIRTHLEVMIKDRNEDFAGLSKLLGRNSAYIQQYIKRGVPRVLSEADRRKLARYFGVGEEEFGLEPSAQSSRTADLFAVPNYSVSASAGFGAFVDKELMREDFAFSRKLLSQICNSSPNDLTIVTVEGDSMAPTLGHGDHIMVDTSASATRVHDGVFVIRNEDTLLVKRLTIHPSGTSLTVSSDNPAYPSLPDCSPADIQVVGKVVWAGRKIR